MKEFLAKSHPKETIQEHSDNLLYQYKILRDVYPNLEINWDILKLACIYHDLGKTNPRFQKKLRNNKRDLNEIPHGILSLPFLKIEVLEKFYSEKDIKILHHAIGYHHDRNLNFDDEDIENEIELMKGNIRGFKYKKIDDIMISDEIDDFYFMVGDRIYSDDKEYKSYIMLKGLLNRIDYAASANSKVEDLKIEVENNFLNRSLESLNYTWRPLQKFMKNNRDENIVAVAQTGMGKTEAGLLWIGDNKGFFTLPLKTAINEIYKRIKNNIIEKENLEKIGLLHSDTYIEYMDQVKDENIDIKEYYEKTRQLSLGLTICTLDQIFDIVYKYRGFEPKLATLSYSKVVIDEVQMYSPDLLAYLILGLKYITDFGGKFAILTATLPGIVTEYLEKEGIPYKSSKTPFVNDKIRHSMKVLKRQIESQTVRKLYNENRILVICNTVKKSQQLYDELKDLKDVNLLHSKFIKKDRKEKEKGIMKLGKNYNGKGIWIATQVVEASLDIDFDILITELSDINGLFQRMGRCYRHRVFDESETPYNCYVYDGGSKKSSGVGNIIDSKIFKLSKKAIEGLDGVISEKEKLNIIKDLYSRKQLEGSKYLEELDNTITYVRDTPAHELNKIEMRKKFRNIDNLDIIPEDIYDEYKNYIKDQVLKIKNRDISLKDRMRAKINIMDLSVSIRRREYKPSNREDIKLNRYESLKIHKSRYSFEKGLEKIKEVKEDFSDRFL